MQFVFSEEAFDVFRALLFPFRGCVNLSDSYPFFENAVVVLIDVGKGGFCLRVVKNGIYSFGVDRV